MTRRRIALCSALGLLVLLGVAATWLFTADLGVLRPYVERLVSDAAGRTFSIDGRFSIDLADETIIIAEDVRLQNPDWADRESMLEIGYAEIHVDLWSVFRDRTEIGYVGIRDARVHLARRAEGDANWEFPTRADDGAEDEAGDHAGDRLRFGVVDVERVALTLDEPQRSTPLEVRIDTLRKENREDGFIGATLTGTIGERAVAFDGSAGPRRAILAGRDVRFDVSGRLDTFTYRASGTIDDLATPARPVLEFAASGPDINDLGRLFGVGDLGDGDIDLRGTLGPAPDGPLQLEIGGHFGELDIEANGRFSDLAHFRQSDLKVLVSGPNLGRILRLAGIHDVADSPFTLRLDAERDGHRLTVRESEMIFGNARLSLVADLPEFPALDDGRIDLDIEGPDLAYFRSLSGLPGVATGEFAGSLDYTGVPDGDDRIGLNVRTSLGRLEVSGTVGPAPGYLGSRIDVRLTGNDLAALGSIAGLDRLPDVPLHARGRLELVEAGLRTLEPLNISANDISVAVDGLLSLPGAAGSRMRVGVEGPSLAAAVAMFADADLVPSLGYAVGGTVELGSSNLRLRGIEGTVGRSAVALDGAMTFRPGIAGSRFDLTSSGPAIEELTAAVPGIKVNPGPYELSGSVVLGDAELQLVDLELDRENGDVRLDMQLTLPPAERRATFDISARGRDFRSIVSDVGAFEIAALPFEIEAKGRLRPERLSLEAFRGTVGELRTRASGSVLLGERSGRANFRISGEIPDIAALGTVGGVRFNPQRIALEAHVRSGDGRIEADDINLVIGRSDLRGRFRYESGPVPALDVAFDSDELIVASLLEEREREYDAEPRFEDGRLIPEIQIPFDRLARIDAIVDVDIGHFGYGQLDLRDVMLRATLQDGVLDLARAGARAYRGRFDVRGRLDPAGGEGRVGIELLARDLMLRPAPDDGPTRMDGDIGMRLEATGNDLRALAASADGHVYFHSEGGRLLRSRILQMIYGDMLGEILQTINPFYEKSTEGQLECMVVPVILAGGKVSSPAEVFLRTDKLNIVAQPELDLDTEVIEIVLRTMPRKGLTISAAELLNPYVKVVGTLASPRLAVDEKGALISGGAAFMTGGLSILARAAWDRLRRSSDPCSEAAAAGVKALGGDPFPEFDAVD